MARQSALLFCTVAVVSLLTADGEQGLDLCVTSRRQIQDRSKQNLSSVPSNLPDNTQYLDVSYNHIEQLDEAPFVRLSKLCFLKVTYCNLRAISPMVFERTPRLQVLNISHNSLFIIPAILLPQLKILDLSSNLYDSYRLPPSFQTLTHLDILLLGSINALSLNYNDFTPFKNISLKHLTLGAGNKWQRYDSGALAELKSLQTLTLNITECENLDIFGIILKDLNETQTRELTFVKPFPDDCNVSGDHFKNLREMPLIQNLTFVNTFINSTFLVLLFKNVWLSPIDTFALVNILYNEDKPEGFQFPSMNHSTNIRSVIFDGVTHRQYRYPKINISVETLSTLTYVKFSHTGMNISPCNLIAAIPSLEKLDLSDNLLSDDGFWWPSCSYTSVFPKLRWLSLSKNRFVSLSFISSKTHQMKALESLDLSDNTIVTDQPCTWPTHLTELSLQNNNLGSSVFKYLSPHFERIDLSKTAITTISQEILSQFPRLTHLYLSSNNIQALPLDVYAPTLLILYVDHNAITSISKESLLGLPRLQVLKAGDNPFACSCDSFWFLTALNKSLLSDWPLEYTCNMPPSAAGLPLSEYKMSKLACDMSLQAAVSVSVTFAICAGLGLVFYVCDGMWYANMLWVWIRVKRRGQKRADMLANASFHYHAFISYSHHDSSWVDGQLTPSLEGAGLSLCIHDRDFVPGEWIIDNIINSVEASYKTLFVLSRNFVQSDWCNYELFFAQHRAISVQEDSLVFILLEPISMDSLPKKFLKLRSLLMQQTYLEWPEDERKQRVFWASLKSMLQAADKRMALKDVAVAISDTLPLLTDAV